MKVILPVLALGAVALLVGGCTSTSDSNLSASKPAAAFPLAGPSWQLVELNGKAVPAAEGLPRPTLQLDATSRRASGTGGVNQYSTNYELNGLALRFGNVASAKRAGPSKAMATEDAYFKTLATVSSWSIAGNQLELNSAEKTVLRFQGR